MQIKVGYCQISAVYIVVMEKKNGDCLRLTEIGRFVAFEREIQIQIS